VNQSDLNAVSRFCRRCWYNPRPLRKVDELD
jgi:hypothetical protein